MSARPVFTQILEIVQELPLNRQTEVLDFALFLREREQKEVWGLISDEEKAALKAEFAEEDISWAEAGMSEYLALLQHEDSA